MFIHDGSQTQKENNLGLWMNSWIKGSQPKRELNHAFGLWVLKTAGFCTPKEEEEIQKEFFRYNKKS